MATFSRTTVRCRSYRLATLHHAADDSFPSDHGTVIFTLRWRFCSGTALWSGHRDDGDITIARRASISAYTLPLDMIGALLVAMLGCPERATDAGSGTARSRSTVRCNVVTAVSALALPIRKGWVRD